MSRRSGPSILEQNIIELWADRGKQEASSLLFETNRRRFQLIQHSEMDIISMNVIANINVLDTITDETFDSGDILVGNLTKEESTQNAAILITEKQLG